MWQAGLGPKCRTQNTRELWGSVQDGASCPHVRSFLSSVDQFVSNLSSARLNMERKFQLQHVELPDAISQLSSPADYRAAANNSELVGRLEEVLTLWTNQIEQVLTESEQMRKEADDVGPSAELELWKRRTVTFNRPVLLQRISDCCNLNAAYQRSFHSVRDKLRENPENRQFDFSENYIFGKFDSFCRRLEKMADMASTLESLAALQSMKVEGMEKICVRYQTIVSTTESKTCDILDHRKLEVISNLYSLNTLITFIIYGKK
ncbi:dynein heavy chain 5, axonemal-like [Oreochromis aureus]|uniref:dynein heavy chain 5, axonemal-like n=1 Tax=Oreochromis aureus TaxID=47969 RepID=UPI001954D161|nr:dynein heavy chain 5, axonemal-like [Oreochromis aureus]